MITLAQIYSIVNAAFSTINALIMVIISILGSCGLLASPSKDTPITFKNEQELQMSFVAYADTQLLPLGYHNYLLDCGFEDIRNSGLDFDALVIAGDLTEMSDDASFEILWNAIDNSTFDKVLLATGNHDIRIDYESRTELVMNKNEEYLGIDIETAYYSYDINGYTFIVLNSDKWMLEKAHISDNQLAFLDSELARATAQGKPAFVVVHQPLAFTHGLPTDWEGADLGQQSDQVREILTKYKNVFLLNGHLHDGITENSLEILDEDNGVYSINLPAYGKENDFGEFLQAGLGAYVEVYDDEVIFTARDFAIGEALDGYTKTFILK